MKKLIPIILLVVFVCSEYSFAGDQFDKYRLRLSDKSGSKVKPYFKDIEKSRAMKTGIINLNLDIQVGADFSNAKIDANQTNDTTNQAQLNALENTQNKVGPTIGATLSVDFLGFGITTGAQYSSKGFKVDYNGQTQTKNMNYINIPLLLSFGFSFGKVMIEGDFGPYFGLLISEDTNTYYEIKNFDLGLTGTLQGAYMFTKILGVLLGAKYDYGGLNNLVENVNINSIRTNTFYVYSGLKINL
jgi:hypothetical protein